MPNKSKKLLILGVSGMLGNTIFRFFDNSDDFDVFGSVRIQRTDIRVKRAKIISGVEVDNLDGLIQLFSTIYPDIVVNCIGVVKQLPQSEDPLYMLSVNSLFPHRLAKLCNIVGARLIHFSTDCVFSGKKGRYTELDQADACDLYGKSKLLGEVDYKHAITLRTSIIGHELSSSYGLLGWFLAQKEQVKGFEKAFFSGFPALEIAYIIRDYVITNPDIQGLYHLSADPISKYELLKLIAEIYGKKIEIIPDSTVVIDRSLDSSKFRLATGFKPKPWAQMIREMYDFF